MTANLVFCTVSGRICNSGPLSFPGRGRPSWDWAGRKSIVEALSNGEDARATSNQPFRRGFPLRGSFYPGIAFAGENDSIREMLASFSRSFLPGLFFPGISSLLAQELPCLSPLLNSRAGFPEVSPGGEVGCHTVSVPLSQEEGQFVCGERHSLSRWQASCQEGTPMTGRSFVDRTAPAFHKAGILCRSGFPRPRTSVGRQRWETAWDVLRLPPAGCLSAA